VRPGVRVCLRKEARLRRRANGGQTFRQPRFWAAVRGQVIKGKLAPGVRMRAGCELRRISVFGPLGGAAVRAQQAPALGTPEGLQTPQSFLLGPSPKLAGPLDCTRILPPSSYLPPHGPAHSCAVAHSDRSFAAGAPADGPPRWATVSPPATALLQLQLQAPLRPPVEIASPWRAGLHPRAGGYDSVEGPVPPGPRDAVEGVPPVSFMEGPVPPRGLIAHTAAASRRSPCAAATPHGASELAQRLECASLLALSDHRTATADLLPQPYLPGPFQARPYWLFTRLHLPSEGRLPARPVGG
jgi:hypothetical protein